MQASYKSNIWIYMVDKNFINIKFVAWCCPKFWSFFYSRTKLGFRWLNYFNCLSLRTHFHGSRNNYLGPHRFNIQACNETPQALGAHRRCNTIQKESAGVTYTMKNGLATKQMIKDLFTNTQSLDRILLLLQISSKSRVQIKSGGRWCWTYKEFSNLQMRGRVMGGIYLMQSLYNH